MTLFEISNTTTNFGHPASALLYTSPDIIIDHCKPQRTVKHYSRQLDNVYQLIEPHVLQKDQKAIRDRCISAKNKTGGRERNTIKTTGSKAAAMATTVIGCHSSGRWGPTLVVSEMQGDLGIICEETKRERDVIINISLCSF